MDSLRKLSAAVSGYFKKPYLVEMAVYQGDELLFTKHQTYRAFNEMDAKRRALADEPTTVEVISILKITEF